MTEEINISFDNRLKVINDNSPTEKSWHWHLLIRYLLYVVVFLVYPIQVLRVIIYIPKR